MTSGTPGYYQQYNGGGGGGGGASGITGPLVAMLLASSVMALVTASRGCYRLNEHWGGRQYVDCSGDFAWAVACPAVSTAFAVVYLVMWFVKGKSDGFIPAGTPQMAVAIFLAVWWAAGVGWMTFDRPFMTPGGSDYWYDRPNGYFGAWFSLLISVKMLQGVVPQTKVKVEGEQSYILVAAIILLIQASLNCDKTRCKDDIMVSVIVGVIALIVALVAMFVEQARGAPLMFVQAIVWTVGWAWCTHGAVMASSGNGYFSLITGFLLSYKICVEIISGATVSFKQ